MRNFYKALTLAVLAGLVCYTGRSLNLQEKSPAPTAEQSLLQAQKQPKPLTKQPKIISKEILKCCTKLSTI